MSPGVEISEIIAGRRVVNYDVLVRIAGGLGIPAAGWLADNSDQVTPA
jgi:plasmid maintenance system antidote protein VapI